MTKTYVKYVAAIVVVGLVIFLSCLSFAADGALGSVKQRAMFCLEQPISNQEAESMRQEIEKGWEKFSQDAAEMEIGQTDALQKGNRSELLPEFCIWGQKDGVSITNQDLERNVQADEILLCGNPELVFEDCRMLDREDTDGCLVDEKTAWELFGSLDVAGQKLTCDGKDYTIRGVIPGNKKIFAILADAGQTKPAAGMEPETAMEPNTGMESEKNVLNRITLAKPEGKTVQELYSEWNNRYDMSAKLMDLELLGGMSGLCMLLVPVTGFFCIGWQLYRQFRKQEHLLRKVGIAVLAVLILTGFCIFLKHQVQIPDEYIPTRWSDFSFWSTLWKDKNEALRLLAQMPKTNMDRGWMAAFAKVAGFGVLSEVLLLPALLMVRRIVSCKKRKVRDIP